MTKARLIYFVLMASLFAYFVALYVKPAGMNDGGGMGPL